MFQKNTLLGLLRGLFNGEFRSKLCDFIECIYTSSVEYRKKHPFFLSELVSMTATDAIKSLNNLHKEIGSPNFMYGGVLQGANARNRSLIEYTPQLCLMSYILKNLNERQTVEPTCPFLKTCRIQSGRMATPYTPNDNCQNDFLKNAIPNQEINGKMQFCAGGAVVKEPLNNSLL